MKPLDRTEKTVPAEALQFAAALEFAKTTDDQASEWPVVITARTGGVADHPYWGPSIHDFAGMKLPKERVPLDYCHSSAEIIGYAEQFGRQGDSLQAAAVLVSAFAGDRASEIRRKGKAGVPYEASIGMSWDGLVVEFVPEGVAVQINGQQLPGPLTVFREWSLRGLAVCPYGTDPKTSVSFSAGRRDATVTYLHPGKEAPPMTTPAAAAPAAPSTLTAEATTFSEEKKPEAPGRKFLDSFGPQGAVWFAEGKSFEEAQALHFAAVRTENEQLKAKLAEAEKKTAAGDRGTDPVSFSQPSNPAAGEAPAGKKSMASVIRLRKN